MKILKNKHVKSKINNAINTQLKQIFNEIIANGAELIIYGGFLRDLWLNTNWYDVDCKLIIPTGIIEKINNILEKYGTRKNKYSFSLNINNIDCQINLVITQNTVDEIKTNDYLSAKLKEEIEHLDVHINSIMFRWRTNEFYITDKAKEALEYKNISTIRPLEQILEENDFKKIIRLLALYKKLQTLKEPYTLSASDLNKLKIYAKESDEFRQYYWEQIIPILSKKHGRDFINFLSEFGFLKQIFIFADYSKIIGITLNSLSKYSDYLNKSRVPEKDINDNDFRAIVFGMLILMGPFISEIQRANLQLNTNDGNQQLKKIATELYYAQSKHLHIWSLHSSVVTQYLVDSYLIIKEKSKISKKENCLCLLQYFLNDYVPYIDCTSSASNVVTLENKTKIKPYFQDFIRENLINEQIVANKNSSTRRKTKPSRHPIASNPSTTGSELETATYSINRTSRIYDAVANRPIQLFPFRWLPMATAAGLFAITSIGVSAWRNFNDEMVTTDDRIIVGIIYITASMIAEVTDYLFAKNIAEKNILKKPICFNEDNNLNKSHNTTILQAPSKKLKASTLTTEQYKYSRFRFFNLNSERTTEKFSFHSKDLFAFLVLGISLSTYNAIQEEQLTSENIISSITYSLVITVIAALMDHYLSRSNSSNNLTNLAPESSTDMKIAKNNFTKSFANN